ncbi:MAG: 50S ribosomal protein L30 [Ardenticatenaceae bacterium]
MKYIRVHYKKSSIGYSKRQKETIRSLGLRKLGQTREHRATPSIMGMCRKVQHLVEWEEVEGSAVQK